MPPELRPRKQGLPADHNYSAPYPNTIYTVPKPVPPKPPAKVREGDPPQKRPKISTMLSEEDGNNVKVHIRKRVRYYGQRKRRRSKKRKLTGPDPNRNGAEKLDCESNVEPEKDSLKGSPKAQNVGLEATIARDALHSTHIEPVERPPASCDCCNPWKRVRQERRQSQRLVIKNYKLPFDQLPLVCKQKIFYNLSPTERAVAAQVCQEWKLLMMRPSLWSHLDLNIFNPIPTLNSPRYRSQFSSRSPLSSQYEWFMTSGDYMTYQNRMIKYLKFLQQVRPQLVTFRFAFDIAHPRDDWLNHLVSLLEHSITAGLKSVQMNWTSTPVRPPCADVFCCLFNKVRVAFQQHVGRISQIHCLLKRFTVLAPRVTTLELPFPWTERSVLFLCRLRQIQRLRLTKYLHFSIVNQDLIDAVFSSLTELSEMEIQICCPSFANKTLYRVCHPRLELFDMSQCQGFFLRSVNLPNLRVLKTARLRWQGPLGSQGDTNVIPCLYVVLKHGAPALTHINKHRLHVYWLEFLYEELDTLLEGICYCKSHVNRSCQQGQEQHHQEQQEQ